MTLTKFDPQGQIAWEETVETSFPLNEFDYSKIRLMEVMTPGLSPLTIGTFLLFDEKESLPIGYWYDFHDNQEAYNDLYIGVGIKSIICALIAFFVIKLRTHSFIKSLGWAIFAFLGGIPVLIVIILLVHKDIKIPCPSCLRKNSVSNDKCSKCDANWSKPESREIDLINV